MASVSFSLNRGTTENTFAAGSQTVTEGPSAPGAGDLEIRVNLADGWTKNEIREAFETIYRFFSNPNNSTSIGL